MIFEAKIWKDKKFWIAEVQSLYAVTQGRSKEDAKEMLKDWILCSLDNPKDLQIKIHEPVKSQFLVETIGNQAQIIALIFKQQRAQSGMSVRELAKKLEFKSANAYAQYERGKTEPSLSQIERILKAIDPSKKIQFKIG